MGANAILCSSRYLCKNQGMEKKDSEEFYERLREQLWENSKWPSDYLYKFIVPTNDEKIKAIQDIFDTKGAVIESKKSKKGTYTSVSITVHLKNPDEVIEKYKEVSVIDGIISL